MKARFKYFNLSTKIRFCGAFFFYALAAFSRLPLGKPPAVPALFSLGGLVLLGPPLWLLAAQNFSSRSTGKEDWQNVSMKEVDRLASRIRKVRQARIPPWYGVHLGIITTLLGGFTLIVAGGLAGTEGIFLLTALYLIFFPWLWFARINKWYPQDLARKLNTFAPVLNCLLETPDKKGGPWDGFKIRPMFRFDKDQDGRKIPEDIRVMLGPPQNRALGVLAELVGVQFQLSFNQGPNGKVPYMYAVFITMGKGTLWQRLGAMNYPGYVVEKDSSTGEGEYSAVVLRLNTKSRSDGYHSREEDIRTLIGHVKDALGKISP